MYITFSASQFKQVWSRDVDQMLYLTLKKPQKSAKAAGAPPRTPLGELTALPQIP